MGTRLLCQPQLARKPPATACFSRARWSVFAEAMTGGSGTEHAALCWLKSSEGQGVLVEPTQGVPAVSVRPITPYAASNGIDGISDAAKAWLDLNQFKAKAGETCLVPDQQGGLSCVLLGVGDGPEQLWPYAALAKLPARTYQLQVVPAPEAQPPAAEGALGAAERAALGFLLGHYTFDRYKRRSSTDGEEGPAKAKLVWPEGCNRPAVLAMARAITWCRTLITTPAEDLGPQHLVAEAEALAQEHGAAFSSISGEELLEQNYPAIHTVGRASHRPPALARLEWAPAGLSDAAALPLLALVGKGVCFDTGGLDIKSAAGMKNMKKDMGGAALMLALAHLVMAARLRVRLLVLIPTVENSIAGNAYRPLDVLRTRAGITVENGNTDAEGRLILSDALYEAAGLSPDLLIDAATLTGAARTALGADVPAVFCNADSVWQELEAASRAEGDPLWRLPLHAPYRKLLDSKVADISSTGAGDGMAGAIIAALFLSEFVKGAPRWVHIDTNGFTVGSSAGPGRPEGGEAMALRALWATLLNRYGLAAA